MPQKNFPLKIFGYGAIYEKVPFFTEGGAADFGLSTISALLCHFNRDITTLLRRKVIRNYVEKGNNNKTVPSKQQLRTAVRGRVVQVKGASLDNHISPVSDPPH